MPALKIKLAKVWAAMLSQEVTKRAQASNVTDLIKRSAQLAALHDQATVTTAATPSRIFRWARSRRRPIAHASNVVYCDGPNSPHAFDNIPLQPRNGTLDAKCPICRGYGQWNTEIDLVSFRCKRAICDYCHGAGWIETGNDPVGHADITMSPEGYPQWVIAFEPHQDPERPVSDPAAPLSPNQIDR